MDFSEEVKEAMDGISLAAAKQIAAERRASIEERQQTRRCACGDRCRNYAGHEAADRIVLIQAEKKIKELEAVQADFKGESV